MKDHVNNISHKSFVEAASSHNQFTAQAARIISVIVESGNSCCNYTCCWFFDVSYVKMQAGHNSVTMSVQKYTTVCHTQYARGTAYERVFYHDD